LIIWIEKKILGKDVTIVAFSRPVKYAIEVADILAKEGVEVEVKKPKYIIFLLGYKFENYSSIR